MNRLIEYFAKQGTFVNLLSVFVFVMGILAILGIRREVFPNVDMDLVTISIIYPGASADTVERLITNPLEQDLKEVEGVKKNSSVSSEGIAFFIYQIDPDQTSTSKAKDEIKDVVDAFTELPDGAEQPVVDVVNSKQTPTIEVALSSDRSEAHVRKAAKELERILTEEVKDLAKVNLSGVRDLEFRVEIKAEQLSKYQLSIVEVVRAIARNNINLPGGKLEGTLEGGFKETIIRTIGEYASQEDIEQVVVRANAVGEAIKVADIAKVFPDFETEKTQYRINARGAMSLTLLKKEKGDAIDMVQDIKEVIEAHKDQLGEGIYIDYINDQSYYVQRRISVLANNLFWGLGLVLIILSLVLPFRVGLITSFGIPFSFLGAIIYFYTQDLSINLISMMGLIIVVGMLVDDAVVITENAQRLREEGTPPMKAAILGTQQMWAPVTVSVLTTVLAFAPLMYMSGIFGKFVKHIPLGVIVALLISLLECFFILPHHLHAWGGKPKNGEVPKGVLTNLWDRYALPAYSSIIGKILTGRYVVLVLVFAFVGLTGGFAVKYMKFILFPPGGIENFSINLEGPNGSSLQNTSQLAETIETQLLKYIHEHELEDITTKVGEQRQGPNDPRAKQGSEFAQIKVYLTPETERQRIADDIIADLKKQVTIDPRIRLLTYEQQAGGPPVGKPVSIGVRGKSYDEILPVVRRVEKLLTETKGVSDILNSFVEGKEEIHVKVNQTRMTTAGLTLEDVAQAVRASIDGLVATSIKQLNEEIDIRVSLSQKDRENVATLDEILIPNSRGNLIHLKNIASFTTTRGIAAYQHKQNQREVLVTAEIDTDLTSSSEVNQKVMNASKDLLSGYDGLSLDFGGENEDTEESLASLKKAFFVAVFLIAIILIMLFKNLYQPLVVMSTIPLGAISVIWSFSMHGMPLSFLGMIGVVSLAGVIVNNAIVFVDFINQHRGDGLSSRDSIIQAAKNRLRPIFLTTVTTVAGILPTAYGLGGKDAFVVPIAMALGWGLLFGSILTTVVLPALVGISDDLVRIFSRNKAEEAREG